MHQELDALFQNFRIVAILDLSRDVFNQIGEIVLDGEIHGLLLVAASAVELDCLVDLTLHFKIMRRLNHILLAGLKRKGHNFGIEAVFLGDLDCVGKSLRLRVVKNGLPHLPLLFVESCEMEASLGFIGLQGNLKGILDIPNNTK